MERELPQATLADIRLEELTQGNWRVIDRRFRETNPRTLLGFIQQTADSFDATDVRRSTEPVRYESREAAVAGFAANAPAPASAASAEPFSLDAVGDYRY
ncbi:hypothetical protein [Parafrigoribacterium soli]|uniref:hypothetical protein n=1 Tax=Parafrigoribacterium soli TaxID=3144663 RepID=UPI0032EF6DA2